MCDLQDIWGKTAFYGQRTDCGLQGLGRGLLSLMGGMGAAF